MKDDILEGGDLLIRHLSKESHIAKFSTFLVQM